MQPNDMMFWLWDERTTRLKNCMDALRIKSWEGARDWYLATPLRVPKNFGHKSYRELGETLAELGLISDAQRGPGWSWYTREKYDLRHPERMQARKEAKAREAVRIKASHKKQDAVFRMRQAGKAYREIGEKLGMSFQNARRLYLVAARRHGVTAPDTSR